MPKLTAEQARDLARELHGASVALGNHRFEHWDELTKGERSTLESLQWSLLNSSTDMTATAIGLTLDDLGDFAGIREATGKLRRAIERVAEVKAAIGLATSALKLAAAVTTGNAVAIAAAVEEAVALTSG